MTDYKKASLRILAGSIFFALLPSSAYPQSPEEIYAALAKLPPQERQQRLIAGAKREGVVVVYDTSARQELREFETALRTKYPFLKVEAVTASRGKLLERVLTESRVGRHLADIIGIGSTEDAVLIQNGILARYSSPEFQYLHSGLAGRDGYWVATRLRTYHIAYNTKIVRKEQAPKRWEDLLDPRWKGKLGMADDAYFWFGALENFWGKEKAHDFFRRLAEQQLLIRKGHSLLAELLAAGEFPVVVGMYGHRVALVKKRGAPVEMVNPDPVVGIVGTVGVAKRAPHPHAAALTVDFTISEEGQKLNVEQMRGASRKGVPHPYLERIEALRIQYDTPDLYPPGRYEQIAQDYRRIFIERR